MLANYLGYPNLHSDSVNIEKIKRTQQATYKTISDYYCVARLVKQFFAERAKESV